MSNKNLFINNSKIKFFPKKYILNKDKFLLFNNNLFFYYIKNNINYFSILNNINLNNILKGKHIIIKKLSHFSNKKIRPQKGTGKSRAGSYNSPIFISGNVCFSNKKKILFSNNKKNILTSLKYFFI